MWNFLNPAALFGLAAAGIPLILHLLSRRRVKIVEFSSVEFLNKMKQTRMRYVRLKEILLLILRTLIITFFVLAFSRPAYRGAGGSGTGPSTTVVLIDDSYSMSRQTPSGTLFEIAKSKALEILESVLPGDEIAVIPFSKISDPRFSFVSPDPSYCSQLIPEYAATADTTVVTSAIMKGIELLQQSGNLNSEMVIISDFGMCGWSSINTIENALTDFEGNIVLVNLSQEETNNTYITEIDYGGEIIQPGVGFNIEATIKNGAPQRQDKILTDLYLDGHRVSQAEISLNPSESGKIQLRATPVSPGSHNGYIEIRDDELQIDNRFYFAFKIPEKIKLLISETGTELSEKIKLAAAPPGITGNHIQTNRVSVSKVISMGIGDFDAAIFCDYRPNQILASKIREFVNKGKGVFIIPASGVDVEQLTDDITKLSLPVEIRKELYPGSEGFFSLENLDTNHPVFSVYHNLNQTGRSFKLPDIVFYSVYSIKTKGLVHMPAKLNGGKPLLIFSDKNNGIVILSTAPFSTRYSDITSSSLFLPMIQRLVEYMTSGASDFGTGYFVNETIQQSIEGDFAPGGIEIVTPGDENIAVQRKESRSGDIAIFDLATEPGIYFVKSGGKIINSFAVNVDTRESQPGTINEEKITKLLKEGHYNFIDQNRDIIKILKEFRYGKEYTTKCFSIALIFLIFEMALAGRWRSGKEKNIIGTQH